MPFWLNAEVGFDSDRRGDSRGEAIGRVGIDVRPYFMWRDSPTRSGGNRKHLLSGHLLSGQPLMDQPLSHPNPRGKLALGKSVISDVGA